MQDQQAAFAALRDATCSSDPVAGHTHNFYRYPARFSPQFARAAIEVFSQPGDVVLDPFMGGGTSAVEALVAGRRFIGCDINPLSLFVSRAKTMPLSKADVRAIMRWADVLKDHVRQQQGEEEHAGWAEYQRNLPPHKRVVFKAALDTLSNLSSIRQRRFARCTLLRTGQWALDCRQIIPNLDEFLSVHRENVQTMAEAAQAFGHLSGAAFSCPPSSLWQHRRLLARPSGGLDGDGRLSADWPRPRLVLTSPPYVGIHVLYHRWQIQGRRETPAPYWLADCRDGHGASFYTFGGRRRNDSGIYMEHLRTSFRSVVALLSEHSVVVQLPRVIFLKTQGYASIQDEGGKY